MTYIVKKIATGEEVYRYKSPVPIEWIGMEFTTHEHLPLVEAPVKIEGAKWRIHVGAFFDRFAEHKVAILADPDPLVQAVIKDASVRQYIALSERRDDLLQALLLLNAKGHALDPVAVLDTEPTADEVWHG